MTKEEINKKAEKHCNEVLCNAHEKCNEFIKCRDWRSRRAGFFCGYEQALKDFEKENAKLKERLAIINLNGNIVLRELTKAKDLLKQWLQTSKASGCDNINIVTDTEQFLEEMKEK